MFDDYIRNIIGSFHPSRPILTNQEIYRKILDINPEFSIVRLYERYKNWKTNLAYENELTQELRTLCFSVSQDTYHEYMYGVHGDIYFTTTNDENGHRLLKLVGLDESRASISDDNTIMTFELSYREDRYNMIYDNMYYDVMMALMIINGNDMCCPYIIKPYVTIGSYMKYRHELEHEGEGEVDNIDEYVDKIQSIYPEFSLSRLYYTTHEQYTTSKKLDSSYIPIIMELLPRLISITFSDDNIYFWGESDALYTIENGSKDLFEAIVANLYHGVNTSEIVWKLDNEILLNINKCL